MIVPVLLALAMADPDAAAASGAKAHADASKDPNRIVCRREEVVGTHRPQKICMTKREWEVSNDQSRNALHSGGVQAIQLPDDGPGGTGGLVGGRSMGPGAGGGPH
jgi:hypothetical protein